MLSYILTFICCLAFADCTMDSHAVQEEIPLHSPQDYIISSMPDVIPEEETSDEVQIYESTNDVVAVGYNRASQRQTLSCQRCKFLTASKSLIFNDSNHYQIIIGTLPIDLLKSERSLIALRKLII